MRKVDQIAQMSNCHSTENFNQLARSLLVVASTPPTKGYAQFTEQVEKYNSKDPFHFDIPKLFVDSKFTKVSEPMFFDNIRSSRNQTYNIRKIVDIFFKGFVHLFSKYIYLSLWTAFHVLTMSTETNYVYKAVVPQLYIDIGLNIKNKASLFYNGYH